MSEILIVGSGAREHAIGWKLKQEGHDLYFAPGNGGTEAIGHNLPIDASNVDKITRFAVDQKLDLVVVGPEEPLSLGLVNSLMTNRIRAFGPTRAAAQLESSKIFSAQFNRRHNIPQPISVVFRDPREAIHYAIVHIPKDYVLKANGLAAGKGVFLPDSYHEAEQIINDLMVEGTLGNAGQHLVAQERLQGREVSVMAFTDGYRVVPMIPAKDYKRLLDNDEGPNTGGMGAIAPCPYVDQNLMAQIKEEILQPAVDGMREEGNIYKGVLYAGLMLTEDGPKVLEWNARFGDPETQVVLRLLKSPLKRIFDACIDGILDPSMVSFEEAYAACIVLAASGYPGKARRGDEIYFTETLDQFVNSRSEVFHAGTKREGNKLLTDGGRVLSVTATSDNLPNAIITANIGANGVQLSGAQRRSDIGFDLYEPIKNSITSPSWTT